MNSGTLHVYQVPLEQVLETLRILFPDLAFANLCRSWSQSNVMLQSGNNSLIDYRHASGYVPTGGYLPRWKTMAINYVQLQYAD